MVAICVAGGNSNLNLNTSNMETYTIPFFIPGDDCTFSVDIEKTRIVYHLKRLIKQEAPALNNLPANSLKLYQVLIDRPPNKEQRIKVLNNLYLNKGGMELDENEKLSRHFGESPPEGMQYYIIVQIPKRESIYCQGVVHRSSIVPPTDLQLTLHMTLLSPITAPFPTMTSFLNTKVALSFGL